MSSLRFDKISGNSVIINENRRNRPHDVNNTIQNTEIKNNLNTCPFCPGNEEKTPKEIFHIGEPWSLRVMPNKFPIIENKFKDTARQDFNIYKNLTGEHYVIIDSNKHFNYLHKMNIDEINNLIACYKESIEKLYNNKSIKYVQLFKNYRIEGGASLEHTHSQIISMNFYPENVDEIIQNSQKHYKKNNSCIFCDLINYELKSKKRIVFENKSFVIITPYASFYPYETAIYPKEHSSSFTSIDKEKISDLSEALSFISKKLYKNLMDPAYNLYFNNLQYENTYFHWSISITPRITKQAGFELSTGVMVNEISPEKARDILSH
ncbi:galactose-1-phosphate uridylyltransferase [Clostridium aestuarii]|uniref:Galactose-1-phosphate uridylyltransferase n=1 Tax=Clostridium aestuarii TaxID=338193 RepID=A0ABT4CZF7_9CLOT|nr:galactose-1-phosphate uridylyltransferase [Clostridium aestuarii]MCY6484369.1 galactose-1-phosphate uridylyltransferase [Clostridium aestuarii]